MENNRMKKAYSLIEMVFVLVLIGITSILFLKMLPTITKATKVTDSGLAVTRTNQLIAEFIKKNKRLPDMNTTWSSISQDNISTFTFNSKDVKSFPSNNEIINYLKSNTSDICRIRNTTDISLRFCKNDNCTSFSDVENISYVVYNSESSSHFTSNGNRITVDNAANLSNIAYALDPEVKMLMDCPPAMQPIDPIKGFFISSSSYTSNAVAGMLYCFVNRSRGVDPNISLGNIAYNASNCSQANNWRTPEARTITVTPRTNTTNAQQELLIDFLVAFPGTQPWSNVGARYSFPFIAND